MDKRPSIMKRLESQGEKTISLDDYLDEQGYSRTKDGHRSCWCGSSDALHVHDNGTRWTCYSPKHERYKCHSGDIIDAVMQSQRLDYKQAVDYISGRSVDLHTLTYNDNYIPKPKPERKQPEIGKYRDYIKQAIEDLKTNQEARDYLHKRGLYDEDIERFMIGSDRNYNGSGRNYIIIPYDKVGTYYLARATDTRGRMDKMNAKGTAPLYNVHAIQEGSTVYVCEAPLDAISMMIMYPNAQAIATSGSGTGRLLDYMDQHSFKDVSFIIAMDSDSSGQTMATNLKSSLMAKGYRTYTFNDYQGFKDANELLQHIRLKE